ncbi:ImuA family protein [Poseidonocella sedimentorum]|uniref:Protein ImuA n=1 Tax=Poseidonocella sedimentorum TaxID=871652 RepID=A0A1I6D2J8_9RHOB|nr:hypothetical protein [Poseidonocella sedimentorum]SFQ99601.1 protein ImuA [Poseidonocella sedimentorum]
MTTHLLDRRPTRDRPVIRLGEEIALARGVVHECCDTGRRSFALWLAGAMEGPVLWIGAAWERARLYPPGMVPFADPGRFLFVDCAKPEDMLWTIEEALRDGAVPLVVADLQGLPNLTQVRRMTLAAEEGASITGRPPLALLLTPGEGGARGVESRWSMRPIAQEDGGPRYDSAGYADAGYRGPPCGSLACGPDDRWHLTRQRARTAPVRDFRVARAEGAGLRVLAAAPGSPL